MTLGKHSGVLGRIDTGDEMLNRMDDGLYMFLYTAQ
jgi:hypothetical protein